MTSIKLVGEAYLQGLNDALKIIASLGYGKNEDVDEGHEDAYRAIEKYKNSWEVADPVSSVNK